MAHAVRTPGAPRHYRAAAWRAQRRTWIFSASALGLFVVLAVAVDLDGQPYFRSDVAVSQAVQSLTWPGLEPAMHAVSLAGDSVLWSSVLVATACLVVLHRRAWRAAAVLLAIVLVGQVLKIGVKDFIERPRPAPGVVEVRIDPEEKYSFPSGHTVHYTVFFGFLWFLSFGLVKLRLLRRALLGVLGALVLAVGLARVYLGAHWMSDVIGGYLLGGAILAAGIGLYRAWTFQGQAPAEPSVGGTDSASSAGSPTSP
jgi:undecaprenyl-diphosphatase